MIRNILLSSVLVFGFSLRRVSLSFVFARCMASSSKSAGYFLFRKKLLSVKQCLVKSSSFVQILFSLTN